MTWTDCEREAFEKMASQVYGKEIKFQPLTTTFEINLETGGSVDVSKGLILFGTLTIGLSVAAVVNDITFIQNAPTPERALTCTYEVSGFYNQPIQIENLLFDEIVILDIGSPIQQVYWNFTGYACKLT